MAVEGNLEYALTRVQAQHGALPSEADWQPLSSSQDLARYLDAARRGPLAPWVAAFDARQDLHVIERALRTQWRSHVERVASWHPREWQPWLRWLAWLPDLPLLAPLARTAAAPGWLLSDPVLGPVAAAELPARAAALGRSPLAPVSRALEPPARAAVVWRERWEQLLPRTDADTHAHVRQLLRALDQHRAALGGGDTPGLRRHLLERLNRLFRLSAGTAVASACHLGTLLLVLERLRGGMAARSLLPLGRAAP